MDISRAGDRSQREMEFCDEPNQLRKDQRVGTEKKRGTIVISVKASIFIHLASAASWFTSST